MEGVWIAAIIGLSGTAIAGILRFVGRGDTRDTSHNAYVTKDTFHATMAGVLETRARLDKSLDALWAHTRNLDGKIDKILMHLKIQ